MVAAFGVSILLWATPNSWPGPCEVGQSACYSYERNQITLNTWDPIVIAHEFGHAYYFRSLTYTQRQELTVGDPRVREEEAFADVFAACVQGRGPRWMSTALYQVTISLERFKYICRRIKGYS